MNCAVITKYRKHESNCVKTKPCFENPRRVYIRVLKTRQTRIIFLFLSLSFLFFLSFLSPHPHLLSRSAHPSPMFLTNPDQIRPPTALASHPQPGPSPRCRRSDLESRENGVEASDLSCEFSDTASLPLSVRHTGSILRPALTSWGVVGLESSPIDAPSSRFQADPLAPPCAAFTP